MRKVRVFSRSEANVALDPARTTLTPETFEAGRSIPVQGKVLWFRVRTTEGGAAANWNLYFELNERYRNNGADIRPLYTSGAVAMTLNDWAIVHVEPIGYEVVVPTDLQFLVATDQNAYDLDIDVCIEETG